MGSEMTRDLGWLWHSLIAIGILLVIGGGGAFVAKHWWPIPVGVFLASAPWALREYLQSLKKESGRINHKEWIAPLIVTSVIGLFSMVVIGG